MSLIGSLEDLGLGDILQIISLSQKSGVLIIRSEEGEGRIVFLDGLVRGALVKGGPVDLRAVLVGGGFVTESDFDAANQAANKSGVTLDEALAARTSISGERIDSLRREAVQSAVVRMFRWTTGEFSFDVREEAEPEDPPIFLPTGINAQYLAMEGSRLDDEFDRGETQTDEGGDPDEMSAHEMFGVTEDSADVALSDPDDTTLPAMTVDQGGWATGEAELEAELVDTVASAAVATADPLEDTSPLDVIALDDDPLPADPLLSEPLDGGCVEDAPLLELVEEAGELETTPFAELETTPFDAIAPLETDSSDEIALLETDPSDEIALLETDSSDHAAPLETDSSDEIAPLETDSSDNVAPLEVVSAAEGSPPVTAATAERQAAPESPPVVVIDADLASLEWTKRVLKQRASRIHIFQRSDQGLARIRQYLARAQTPLVFVSPEIAGDPLSGIADAVDFTRRLKRQSARMRVVWLREDGTSPVDQVAPADAQAVRPATYQFRNPGAARQLVELADGLLACLDSQIASRSESSGTRDDISPEALRQLKSVTVRLNDASSRGEVLPVVISFAAESFSRVAMFVVRGDQVMGMAQQGLDRAGGPSDEGLRQVCVETDSGQWLRAVLGSRTSTAGPPGDLGDKALASALGDSLPSEAYLAPIESGGQVVALLYADNLPGGQPLGDTSALEVVLHHAGLALDRAALERALAESESAAEAASAPEGGTAVSTGAAGD